jgi:hypothetical protein
MQKIMTKTQEKRMLQKQNKKVNDELDKQMVREIHDFTQSEQDKEKEKSILDKLDEKLDKKEPIIQLFDIQNIKLKANLTEEQRNTIVILMATYNEGIHLGAQLSQELGFPVYLDLNIIKMIVDEYVDYSPSIDGKRAEQFVDAHKAQVQQFMNPMGQMNGYGQFSPQMQQMRK